MSRVQPQRRVKRFACAAVLCATTGFAAIPAAVGQMRRIGIPINRRGASLPYQTSDGHGGQWLVYQPSCIQMQGNFPIFSQTAMIAVNGQQPNGVTTAHLDDKTGELVLENMQVGSVSLTRRMLFNTDDGYVRVIDVLKNTQGQDQQVSLQLTSSVNYGVQGTQTVPDPKKAGQTLAWIGLVNAGQPRAAVDVFAGPGAKVCPSIDATGNTNQDQASATLSIPANKEVAVAHFHMVMNSADQATQWIAAMNPRKLFADVPKDVRRAIVNFRLGQSLLGDLEVLRGDALDVVELRSGDRLNGTLTDPAYKLDTFYGTVELPVDQVVGILNVGQYRPRQLLVTADGQIFGGHLEQPTLGLELSSGQRTQIPLAQVVRAGYRRRPTEAADAAADDDVSLQPPYLLMTAGDRVGIEMPTAPLPVATRYGQMSLDPSLLAGVVFSAEDGGGVHTILLTDGSRFNGLVTSPTFEAKLTTGAHHDPVKFPVGSLARIVFKNQGDDRDPAAPLLSLKKDDQLVGTLQGSLKLETAFDTIGINAPEIRTIARSKENGTDLTITTWDGTAFSGQLQEQELACHLNSGLDVRVPTGLVDAYTNPAAAVPPKMAERITQLVVKLDADDWKARDAAEQELVTLGPGVASMLRGLRDKQSPEAQQRIDAVLKQVQKDPAAAAASSSSSSRPPAMMNK